MFISFFVLGDPSLDGRARFNLSPVPSMDGDEDDTSKHQNQEDYPNLNQNDSDEEFNPIDGRRGSTIAVNMYDDDHNVNIPLTDKYENEQSKIHL